MHVLAALPFVVAAFWAGAVFSPLRSLAARQRASLEGVRL
jgi:hypothetical protein